MEANGDCYEVAANIMMAAGLETQDTQLILVHGAVMGSGQIEGLIHGHAWVEDRDLVIDYSNGHQAIVDKDLYYEVGEIKVTCRYTFKDMRDRMLKHEHYGPWDLDVEI